MKLVGRSWLDDAADFVAFTPKGGCPLKHVSDCGQQSIEFIRSIHPQGWVPIETQHAYRTLLQVLVSVAFTPKGGCRLKLTGGLGD